MAFHAGENFLGIDIGSSSLKMVELRNENGRPKLVTYGYMERPNQLLKVDNPTAKQKIIETIKQVADKAHVTTNRVVAALPSYTVFSSIITLPQMKNTKELDAAVQWEAKKFVPMPLEKMNLDWQLLDDNHDTANVPAQNVDGTNAVAGSSDQQTARVTSQPKKYSKILLTAAPADLVARYLELMQAAGLHLDRLETEAFALERALIGHDPAPILIVDIGASTTSITVVMASVPVINRSIDLGGQTITKTIANSLNIDHDRAEQFKRDFGLIPSGATSNQIPKRIEFMVSSVINEIRYVMNLFHNQSNNQIEKIVLTGGSAWLPNLPQYLSQVLNIKVIIGDPWSRVIYPVELKPVLAEIGPRLAVAAGLAMSEIV
ncbi:MAG: pilus assembly protein PilM [Candidatus Kerfeldbacteria bacterium]|nr:pilus assembly protein PilM [Candidatus Kerfeldbacteria bacterium]